MAIDYDRLPPAARDVLRRPRARDREAPPALARFAAWLDVEHRLRNAGWHATSDRWQEVMLRSIGARRVVISAGRRAGKSETICRWAVGELLAGILGWAHPVSPGDVGTGVILSARREQAADRLETLKSILDVCEIDYRPKYHQIDIVGYPYRFMVYTANKASVVSQTTFFAMCDEMARWRDDRTGINPAKEIVNSLSPSLITDPDAVMAMISSPWVEGDLFDEELAAAREMPSRFADNFPTWIGNPTVTEQMTREEEPDEMVWSREYEAIPMTQDEQAMFDAWAIDAAIGIAS